MGRKLRDFPATISTKRGLWKEVQFNLQASADQSLKSGDTQFRKKKTFGKITIQDIIKKKIKMDKSLYY